MHSLDSWGKFFGLKLFLSHTYTQKKIIIIKKQFCTGIKLSDVSQELYLWWWCNCVYSVQLCWQLPQNSCHQKVLVKLSSSNHRNCLHKGFALQCMCMFFFLLLVFVKWTEFFSHFCWTSQDSCVHVWSCAVECVCVINTISQRQQQGLIQCCMIHHLHKLQS